MFPMELDMALRFGDDPFTCEDQGVPRVSSDEHKAVRRTRTEEIEREGSSRPADSHAETELQSKGAAPKKLSRARSKRFVAKMTASGW